MDLFQNTELWILARVAAAMALGGVLGIERELGRHAAGLRTHMMIAGAAALIVGLGDVVAEHFTQEQYRDLLRIDPGRLIESVVAAVGFVGAGAILRARGDQQVRGLTTASSLLMAAAIGIAAGLGNYLLALGASLLCVVVLAVFRRVESRLGTDEPGDDRS
ncbi:MgtC/SapB family protein [Luteimonas sp. MJ250]|uniref:MgtC/SapB family protein n=1 Tax=Luteimonas TaxID=83614 RepID=UPI0031BA44D7